MHRAILNGNTIRFPVHAREKLAKIDRAINRLWSMLEREPTAAEVGSVTGLSVAEIEKLKDEARRMLNIASLDAQVKSRLNTDDDDRLLYDCVSDEFRGDLTDLFNEGFIGWLEVEGQAPSLIEETRASYSTRADVYAERRELRDTVAEIINQAPLLEVEKYCLKQYYWEDKTYEEIGASLGITRERIRQRIESALSKLRNVKVWENVRGCMPNLTHPDNLQAGELWSKGFACIEAALSEEEQMPDGILLMVCSSYNMPLARLTTPSQQTKEDKIAARVAAYLLSRMCGLSHTEIAPLLGKPASTIQSFIIKVETELKKWGRHDLWKASPFFRGAREKQEIEVDFEVGASYLSQLLNRFPKSRAWASSDVVSGAASLLEVTPEVLCKEKLSAKLVSLRVACAYILATRYSHAVVDDILHAEGFCENYLKEFARYLRESGQARLLLTAFSFEESQIPEDIAKICREVELSSFELFCFVRKLGIDGKRPLYAGSISQLSGTSRAEVERHYAQAIEKLWLSSYWDKLCEIVPRLKEG